MTEKCVIVYRTYDGGLEAIQDIGEPRDNPALGYIEAEKIVAKDGTVWPPDLYICRSLIGSVRENNRREQFALEMAQRAKQITEDEARVVVVFKDDAADIPTSLVACIEWLGFRLHEIPAEYREAAEITINTDYDGGPEVLISYRKHV